MGLAKMATRGALGAGRGRESSTGYGGPRQIFRSLGPAVAVLGLFGAVLGWDPARTPWSEDP
jgi:hypothetical protein